MIYIVEGVDGVGKSTFINKFAELTGYKVVKGSSFELAAEGVDMMYSKMYEMMNSEEDLILDRSFISNLVYAPIYDKNKLSYNQYSNLLLSLIKNCKLIYLTCPYSILHERFIKRGDDYISDDLLFELTKQYEGILSKLSSMSSNFKYTQFNTGDFHSEDLARAYFVALESDNLIRTWESKEDLNVSKISKWNVINRFNEFIIKLYVKLFK